MRRKKTIKLRRFATGLIAVITTLATVVAMYGCVVWLNIPGISTWRNIWIETAMTTFTHQWLATSFFPQWLINDIMAEAEYGTIVEAPDVEETESEFEVKPDPLGQADLVEGQPDEHGNTVVTNDIDEGIVIVEVNGSTPIGSFTGKLALIDDPSRVFVGTTNKKDVHGQVICEMMQNYGAVLAVNASGFEDPDGHGKGGVVNGLCYSEGVAWGKLNTTYSSIIISKNNKLIVGDISDWDAYGARDGAQFFPVVISEGKTIVGNSYSQQPRTIVAQRDDGVMMFLVIEGRSISSAGATYKQCAEILLEYGAVTAAACDGGSSSIMAYNNKTIIVPSTPMKDTGRYLPNAFMVRSKKS